jgi:5-methylcytosine-specific restriction endonuclease McrA
MLIIIKMDYLKYINSNEWKDKSKEFIIEKPACERCGSGFNLTCHHKHYRNLGCETRKDVIVLCWNCHKRYHTKQNKRVRTKDLQNNIRNIRYNNLKELQEFQNRPCIKLRNKIEHYNNTGLT